MGYGVSVTRGYGFAIPAKVIEAIQDAHEDDDDFFIDDHLDGLFAPNLGNLLTYASATYMGEDYKTEAGEPCYAILIKSTAVTDHGVGVFANTESPRAIPTADGFNALGRVSEFLGIEEEELDFLTVVSYG